MVAVVETFQDVELTAPNCWEPVVAFLSYQFLIHVNMGDRSAGLMCFEEARAAGSALGFYF